MTAVDKFKLQLERRILGAILLESNVYPRVGHLLMPEDFTSLPGKDHTEIFTACAELYPKCIINTWNVDVHTARRYSIYLRELTAPVCSSANVPHEIGQLHEINLLSELSSLLQGYLEDDYEGIDYANLQEFIQTLRYDSIFDSVELLDEACLLLENDDHPQYILDSVYQLRMTFNNRFDKTAIVSQAEAAIFNLEALANTPQRDLRTKKVQRVLVDWTLAIISTGRIEQSAMDFILTYKT